MFKPDCFIYIDPGFTHDIGHYVQMSNEIHKELETNNIKYYHLVNNKLPQDFINKNNLYPIFKYKAFITAELFDAEDRLFDFYIQLSAFLDKIYKEGVRGNILLFMYTSHPFHLPIISYLLNEKSKNSKNNFKCFGITNIFYIDKELFSENGERYLDVINNIFLLSKTIDINNLHTITVESKRSFEFFKNNNIDIKILDSLPLGKRKNIIKKEKEKVTISYIGYPSLKVGYRLLYRVINHLINNKEIKDKIDIKIKHRAVYIQNECRSLYRMINRKNKQYQVLEGFIPSEQYEEYFNDIDILLIPYSKDYYPIQTSGLVVDGLINSKILVVPENTWLSDSLSEYGSGIGFESNDLESLLKSIKYIINNFQYFNSRRERNIEKFIKLHSVENFFIQLFSFVDNIDKIYLLDEKIKDMFKKYIVVKNK